MAVYELPDLPYAYDALEPHISEEIMTLHHDKHHATYVAGANAALEALEAERNGEANPDKLRALSKNLSLIHISEPTRRHHVSRMPSSA